MDREENLLIAKNLLRVIEKLQRAGRRGDIIGVIANELDAKDRKSAQQVRAADGGDADEFEEVMRQLDPHVAKYVRETRR